MALLTSLDEADAKAVCARFGLELLVIEPLAVGSVNSNFRLQASDGKRYFARIYEEQDVQGAQSELALVHALLDAGVPAVRPLAARAGETEPAEVSGKPFAIFPWVDGEIVCQARVTERHAAAIGAALAKIHVATPRLPALSEGRFRVEALYERLSFVERAGSAELPEAARQVRKLAQDYVARRDATLPRGVIHGDLFRDNVLWNGTEIAALLDFESASNGPFVYDLAVTALAWCYGERLEPSLVTAMARGYASVRALTDAEKRSLRVEAAIACLRFATTRMTDFSMRAAPGEPPKRDYRRFLARLTAIEAGELDALQSVLTWPSQ